MILYTAKRRDVLYTAEALSLAQQDPMDFLGAKPGGNAKGNGTIGRPEIQYPSPYWVLPSSALSKDKQTKDIAGYYDRKHCHIHQQ